MVESLPSPNMPADEASFSIVKLKGSVDFDVPVQRTVLTQMRRDHIRSHCLKLRIDQVQSDNATKSTFTAKNKITGLE